MLQDGAIRGTTTRGTIYWWDVGALQHLVVQLSTRQQVHPRCGGISTDTLTSLVASAHSPRSIWMVRVLRPHTRACGE